MWTNQEGSELPKKDREGQESGLTKEGRTEVDQEADSPRKVGQDCTSQ